jgi:hypothetical protein
MTRFRILGLAAAVACVSALALAATAFAHLPELGRCQALEAGTGGKYSDAGCTVHAKRKHGVPTGGYEWAPLSETINSGGRETPEQLQMTGSMVFETAAGNKIECAEMSVEATVTYTGAQSAKTPLWQFENCSAEGQPCRNSHAPEEGEINNEYAWFEESPEEGVPIPGWRGRLGFISKGASPVVGVDYTVLNDELLFEPTVCKGLIGTVWIGGGRKGHDSFISRIEPLNEMTSRFTETYTESAPGIQSDTKLGGHNSWLEAFIENHWERVALSGTFTYGFERGEELEIKAIP